jgi:hypothetical protein
MGSIRTRMRPSLTLKIAPYSVQPQLVQVDGINALVAQEGDTPRRDTHIGQESHAAARSTV